MLRAAYAECFLSPGIARRPAQRSRDLSSSPISTRPMSAKKRMPLLVLRVVASNFSGVAQMMSAVSRPSRPSWSVSPAGRMAGNDSSLKWQGRHNSSECQDTVASHLRAAGPGIAVERDLFCRGSTHL